MSDFRKDLEHLINCHSKENGSDTPDFILAEYLCRCLAAWDSTTEKRDKWYGFESLSKRLKTRLEGPPEDTDHDAD